MPLPLLPLAIAAGALVSGAGVWQSSRQSKRNREAQEKQNEENRRLEQQRYEQQRADELANWDRQNAFNSPQEQMNRLRQAGLSPHLVYGKGADVTADAIKPTGYSGINAAAPQSTFNPSTLSPLGDSMMKYYDIKNKQAQTDNLAASTALSQQEALFKQANTAKTIQDTAKGTFELGQAQELKDSVIQNAKLTNEKLRADTAYTLDANQRSQLQSTQDLKLSAEKIITEKIAHAKDQAQIDMLKGQLQQVQQTVDINRYEQKLTEMGIHKNDPAYFRAFMNLINGNMQNPLDPILNKINPLVPEYNRKAEDFFNTKK